MCNKEEEMFTISNMKNQEIIRNLRNEKFRITNQRKMLLDIILKGDCTCCKEIYYEALKNDPNIGIATVYRIVHTLEHIGAINRKKQYQIQNDYWNKRRDMYKIILDDQTVIQLSQQRWMQVVASGLKCCGYMKNQNLKSVALLD